MERGPFFRQLFDPETSTYTYLLADEESREAILIDTVLEHAERDETLLREHGFKLVYLLETHVHADHVTGAATLAARTGARIGVGQHTGAEGADIYIEDGAELRFGRFRVKALTTPGHTAGCVSYYVAGRVFTGDVLFIRDVGRSDFQEGSPEAMFASITEKLFSLPDDTEVYPAHDYRGHTVSTIGEEKRLNAKLGGGVNEEEFRRRVGEMRLAPPRKLATAVPANLRCGRPAK